jgi:predicted acylesterase/phospholipase RssA
VNPANTALVLSGGGAYGAFGIGVMKVLYAGASPATNYEPFAAGIFSGTSIGAFNAAAMVDQPHEDGLDRVYGLERVWLELIAERPGKCGNGIFRLRGNPVDYLDMNCLSQPATVASRLVSDGLRIGGYLLSRTANFVASSSEWSNRLLGLVNASSFVDDSPYFSLLHQLLDENQIRQSPRLLQVITTNWITGETKCFTNSDFHDDRGASIIRASTALPGFFPPVVIGQDLFVDGGVVENTPLSSAIKGGATELHVIYLDPQPRFIPLKGEPNAADTLLRVYYLMLASKFNEDIETARWINDGLDAVERYQETGAASVGEAQDFIKVAKQILSEEGVTYKKLTIHRYFPTVVLGAQLDLLNFSLDRIVEMIDEGERVALIHNCAESGCLV